MRLSDADIAAGVNDGVHDDRWWEFMKFQNRPGPPNL